MGANKMTNPSIDWNASFPATDGPGINGYFDPEWSGEMVVKMTIIVPDDGQEYSFLWWQEDGGSQYGQDLSPGQNDLSFTLNNAGSDFGLVRALVWLGGGTAGVNVTIPEAPVLSLPSGLVASDDEATTNADTPVTVDVLANDTFNDEPVVLEQLEGPPTIHEQPANGTVSVAPDGKITYTPNPGFTGTDEFVYRIAAEPIPANRVDACGISGEGGFEIFDHPDIDFSIPMVIDDGWGGYAAYVPQTGWGTYPRWTPTYFDGQAWIGEGEEYTAYQGDREFTIVLHSGIAFTQNGGYWYQDGAYNLWPFDLSKPFQIEFNGTDYAAEFDQNEAILTVTPNPGFAWSEANYVTIKQEGFEDEDPEWPYSVEYCGIVWMQGD